MTITLSTTNLQVGVTGTYTVSDPTVTVVSGTGLTVTGPDSTGNGTFTPTEAGSRLLQFTDGTIRYFSDVINCWAYVTPYFDSLNLLFTSTSSYSGSKTGQGVYFKYGSTLADISKFSISYNLASGSSSVFTGVSAATSALYYSRVTVNISNASLYTNYSGTITATFSSDVDYYILQTSSKSGSLSLYISEPTPTRYDDVVPPSNFINQTYNLDSSGNPETKTVTWTQGSSSYYTQVGTISGTEIGSYTAIFQLTQSSTHRWTDGTTANKSFTWKILDPYVGYSRPYINNEAYDAIVYENGVPKLVILKVGDT